MKKIGVRVLDDMHLALRLPQSLIITNEADSRAVFMNDQKAANALNRTYDDIAYVNNTLARSNAAARAVAIPIRVKVFQNTMPCAVSVWNTLWIYIALTRPDPNLPRIPMSVAFEACA
ncbi:hypothetical protein BGZ96_002702 [Linnemannia gamsii]|uniref:Uncharacterized protein n=1 Tax=Linnemannia gamsii TaxID=64522 RepID=A0ABQ7K8D9_9FUNG|nr:hypothetical protein BGZ96_002702 [Linnemannia gamsii]